MCVAHMGGMHAGGQIHGNASLAVLCPDLYRYVHMGTSQYSAPICTDMHIRLQEREFIEHDTPIMGGSMTPVTETACMHIYSFIQGGAWLYRA